MKLARSLSVLLPLGLLPVGFLPAACGDDAVANTPDNTPDACPCPAPDANMPPLATPAVSGLPPYSLADGCPDLYAQEYLPTYQLDIAESEWDELEEEWAAGAIVGQFDPDLHPEHPLAAFRCGAETVANATIRVRGNPDWWVAGEKMQFEISFNTVDPDGRFHGLRHLVLDAAAQNRSYLRDRLALAVLRDMGVPAPCANNARVVVNGAYYGLYSNIEKVDKSFLKRRFANASGNLYKRKHWILKTNEEAAITTDLATLLDTTDVATLATRMDLDQAVLEWAGEAVLPDADGAWAGGLNYYLYNEPGRGFVVIPWDLDATFTRLPADTDPMTWRKEEPWGGRPFYDLVLADPVWRARYRDALLAAMTAFDPGVLRARLEQWSAQIADAAEADPMKPFTTTQFHQAVTQLYAFVGARRLFLDTWLGGMP